MKKSIKYILIGLAAITALTFCSCNEYKEAQDEAAKNLTGLMSEAQDLQSEFNSAASELSDMVSDIHNGLDNAGNELNSAAGSLQSGINNGKLSKAVSDIKGSIGFSESTQNSNE